MFRQIRTWSKIGILILVGYCINSTIALADPPLLPFEQASRVAHGCKQMALPTQSGEIIGGGEIYCREGDGRWYRSSVPSIVHPSPDLSRVTAEDLLHMATLYYGMADYEGAFRWHLLSAQRGNETAMFQVAIAFHRGSGTSYDLEKALYWYDRAEAQARVTGNQNILNLVAENRPRKPIQKQKDVVEIQTTKWPDLLHGTWKGTVCKQHAIFVFFSGRLTISSEDRTGKNSAQAAATIIRSKTLQGSQFRYDQYYMAHSFEKNGISGTPLNGNARLVLRYDPQDNSIYGNYVAPGSYCKDVLLTKKSNTGDSELMNLESFRFVHLF